MKDEPAFIADARLRRPPGTAERYTAASQDPTKPYIYDVTLADARRRREERKAAAAAAVEIVLPLPDRAGGGK